MPNDEEHHPLTPLQKRRAMTQRKNTFRHKHSRGPSLPGLLTPIPPRSLSFPKASHSLTPFMCHSLPKEVKLILCDSCQTKIAQTLAQIKASFSLMGLSINSFHYLCQQHELWKEGMRRNGDKGLQCSNIRLKSAKHDVHQIFTAKKLRSPNEKYRDSKMIKIPQEKNEWTIWKKERKALCTPTTAS